MPLQSSASEAIRSLLRNFRHERENPEIDGVFISRPLGYWTFGRKTSVLVLNGRIPVGTEAIAAKLSVYIPNDRGVNGHWACLNYKCRCDERPLNKIIIAFHSKEQSL